MLFFECHTRPSLPLFAPPPPCIYTCIFFSVIFLRSLSLTHTSCIVPSSAASLFADASTHCTSSGCVNTPVMTREFFIFVILHLLTPISLSQCGVPLLLSCAASPLPPAAHHINPLPRQRPGFHALSTPWPLHVVNAPASAYK